MQGTTEPSPPSPLAPRRSPFSRSHVSLEERVPGGAPSSLSPSQGRGQLRGRAPADCPRSARRGRHLAGYQPPPPEPPCPAAVAPGRGLGVGRSSVPRAPSFAALRRASFLAGGVGGATSKSCSVSSSGFPRFALPMVSSARIPAFPAPSAVWRETVTLLGFPAPWKEAARDPFKAVSFLFLWRDFVIDVLCNSQDV